MCFISKWKQNENIILDRILEQLHSMASSPQPVPNSAKSPTQDSNSLGSSYNSSRWKRCSPDPNKMMGRSPNVLEVNSKRILSTTPSRRGTQALPERVGSPSLSGYPVRIEKENENRQQNLFVTKFIIITF